MVSGSSFAHRKEFAMPTMVRTDDPTNTRVVKGAGLARGPALIIGMVLAVFGLILFFKVTGTPLSTAGFPDATVQGEKFLGFEANAWTAWFTIAAGVLLLFGAAQHLAAKTMSLIVGLALGAAAVIALVDGDDVLGLAAANGLTALGWGIASALLLFNTLAPRVRRERPVARENAETRADLQHDRDSETLQHDHDGERHERDTEREPLVASERTGADREYAARSEEQTERTPVADRPVGNGAAPMVDQGAARPRTPFYERDSAPTEVREEQVSSADGSSAARTDR
jgi:hypothetical protein